jgi:hypothetical protein
MRLSDGKGWGQVKLEPKGAYYRIYVQEDRWEIRVHKDGSVSLGNIVTSDPAKFAADLKLIASLN